MFATGLTWSAQAELAPPHSHPYGKSLPEWFVQYQEWLALGPQGPEVFQHVLFPVVTDASVTGSGTFEDPLVVTGHANYTVKPGAAFYILLLGSTSEIYMDGSTDSNGSLFCNFAGWNCVLRVRICSELPLRSRLRSCLCCLSPYQSTARICPPWRNGSRPTRPSWSR